MPGEFDISTLLSAKFPEALCPRCAAIILTSRISYRARTFNCECCGVKFEMGGTTRLWSSFFGQWGTSLNYKDRLQHATTFAQILRLYQDGHVKPIDLLFRLLAASKYFVHFATFNFTTEFIGALAMLSTRIPVRGIIGESLDRPSDAYKLTALRALEETCSSLKITLTGTDSRFDSTHQKVYVFDGIVAVAGSANLSLDAWKKAADSKEQLEVYTDLGKVRQLNNDYIAKHFRRLQNFDRLFVVDDEAGPEEAINEVIWGTNGI